METTARPDKTPASADDESDASARAQQRREQWKANPAAWVWFPFFVYFLYFTAWWVDFSDIHVDQQGDAHHYVDLTRVDVSVGEGQVTAALSMRSLAPKPSVNSPALPDSALEYSWAVYFDVDGDNTRSNDLVMGIFHFKPPDAEPDQGRILNFAQTSLARCDDDNTETMLAQIEAWQTESTLHLRADPGMHKAVYAIAPNTPYRVQTYYRTEAGVYWDQWPDGGSYYIPH